jgi:hypothetical protein
MGGDQRVGVIVLVSCETNIVGDWRRGMFGPRMVIVPEK